VYLHDNGEMSVLVEASLGKGRAPVILQQVTAENVVARVLPLVKQMARPKAEQPELPL
jgi:hypothetical protein